MAIKAFFVGSLLISILISSANPGLATKNDDEPWIDPDTGLKTVFAESPISSEYNEDVINKVPSEYFDYLVNCSEKRGRNCNEEMMQEILQNKDASKKCCLKIARAGKDCHMGIANVMFKNYHIKRFAFKSAFKANNVWNRCSAQIESPSPISG